MLILATRCFADLRQNNMNRQRYGHAARATNSKKEQK
jgi:hypothetical protein